MPINLQADCGKEGGFNLPWDNARFEYGSCWSDGTWKVKGVVSFSATLAAYTIQRLAKTGKTKAILFSSIGIFLAQLLIEIGQADTGSGYFGYDDVAGAAIGGSIAILTLITIGL